jgi:prophage regulatory protein
MMTAKELEVQRIVQATLHHDSVQKEETEKLTKKLTKNSREDHFLRVPDVLAKMNFSRATLYHMIAKGEFPQQIKLGGLSVWSSNAVNDWMTAKNNVHLPEKGDKS